MGFAILLLLCLVIICVSITCTYVLLNAEDYRWQWQSFLCCAATSAYVFLYTIHYFYNSTQMSGFLQTAYYFGTSLNFCIGLGLLCVHGVRPHLQLRGTFTQPNASCFC